jgi:putative DNA primase/helicase
MDNSPFDRAEAIADEYIDSVGGKPQNDALAEYARLAELPLDEYDRQREAGAEKLGIRVGTLDRLVKQARKGGADDQGNPLAIKEVEPWIDQVNGSELVGEISKAILGHIVLTIEQADTVALWSLYTHAFDVWRISPRLGFRAASKGCGKTEALRRLKRLVARPISCENLTTAVLFRLSNAVKPTMLLDEGDNLLTEDKSAILGVMNSGYERDGKVLRCVGDQNDLHAFSTFMPMAYAMIGTPPGTFDSRTIAIEMRRATPTEARRLLSMEDGEPEDDRFKIFGRKAARWAKDNLHRLSEVRPDMGELVNRTADNWRALFAIADVAGGPWPERARLAAKALSETLGTEEVFEQTVQAINGIIGERDEITSREMTDRLVEIEDGPWAEWGKDRKPMTQNALARLLKPHKVFPSDIGPERMRRKGYRRSQFDHLFEAYLKPSPPPPEKRASAQDAMESGPLSIPTRAARMLAARMKKSGSHRTMRTCADARMAGGCVDKTSMASIFRISCGGTRDGRAHPRRCLEGQHRRP